MTARRGVLIGMSPPARTPRATHWTVEVFQTRAPDTLAGAVSEALTGSSPFKTHFQSRGGASADFPIIRLNSSLHWSTKFSERWNSTNRFAAADNLYALASCGARSSASANTSGSCTSHSRPSENFGTMYANHPLFAAKTIFPAVRSEERR